MTQQKAGAVYQFHKGGQRAVLALALIFLLLAISACSGKKDTPEVEAYPSPNPLLYELANTDGQIEGWLLGTIHALPDDVAWRTPPLDGVVKDANLLLVEVAELGATEQIAESFAQLSYTPGLAPIGERVSPTLRPQLEMMLANSDFSQGSFANVEDWASAIMLAQVDAPGDPSNGVDKALIADFQGRKIRGFETARGQLAVFDSLAAEDQRELLEGTIAEWAASQETPGRLLHAWIAGDVETLEKATNEGIMADPEIRDALLVNRNKDWTSQLLPVLNTRQKPLIAVGAAHLVGPDGLPAMLEQNGYTVRRLSAR